MSQQNHQGVRSVGDGQHGGPVGESQQEGPVGDSQHEGPLGDSEQEGSAEDNQQGDDNQGSNNPRSFITSRENWLKGNLALLCTKDGLKEFVETEIIAMHDDILKDLYETIPAGTVCSQCTIANLTRCSNSGVCGRNCRIHDPTDPTKRYRPCPNDACNEFMEQIHMYHRYGPTWQNTDATKWFSNPWEIAKCFLPHGYGSSSSASEADLSELLNIIINNCRFEQKLTEYMKNDNNIYCQARTVRNDLFHTGSGEMSEGQLHDIIALLINVLSDGRCLVNNPTAIEAVDRLIKLRDEPLVISQEEAQRIKQEAHQQYEIDKRRLQCHLAEHYLTQYSKVPVSHLVSEIAAELDDVCALQSMKQVKLPYETEYEGRKQLLPGVNSYKDVFLRNAQRCRNIYIKGDAGTGKSFFLQKMAQAWSRHIKGQSIEEDQIFIKKFSFLFYITLKHMPSENDLDELIFNHPFLQCEEHKILIKRLLQSESNQCLILLDGLDEWSPEQNIATMATSKGLPRRDVTRRCTIVTTTRPWKIEAVRMDSTEIDQLIELSGLDDSESEKYIASLVRCLNERFGVDKPSDACIAVLKDNNIKDFGSLPVLLKYLVCLWHDDQAIGNSLCEIYSGMIDFLLHLPERESAIRSHILESIKQASPSYKLPPCFDKYPDCVWFGQVLVSLSKLSFYTLFNEKRESSLVFDSSVTKKHGMSPDEIQACLNAGILSQDIVMEKCSVREHKFSFLHKTFQEFLAAVYICLFHDTEDDITKKVRDTCCSVEIVLEMQKVFVFLSGMCPSVISSLSGHIAAVIAGDEKVQTYRNTMDTKFSDLQNICVSVQRLMLDCMKEAQCNGVSQDLNIYIQDIIEHEVEQVPDIIDELIQSSNGHIKSINITGHDSLARLQYVTQTGVLNNLALHGDPGDAIPLSSLARFIHQYRTSIRCLFLKDITCVDMSVQKMSELFESLSDLEFIGLNYAVLSHEQYVWLMSYISQRNTLRQVYLHSIKCFACDYGNNSSYAYGTLDPTCYGQQKGKTGHGTIDLTSHGQLTTLKLSDLQVDNIYLPTHCRQLNTIEIAELHTDQILLPTHCPELNTLLLGDVKPDIIRLPFDVIQLQTCRLLDIHTPGVTLSVVQMLRHCSDLQSLSVGSSPDEKHTVTDSVISVVSKMHNIRYISLWNLLLVDRVLRLSPSMTYLERFRLSEVTISSESLQSLVTSLLEIQHSVEVELWNITITPYSDVNTALGIIRSSDRCVVTWTNTHRPHKPEDIMFFYTTTLSR